MFSVNINSHHHHQQCHHHLMPMTRLPPPYHYLCWYITILLTKMFVIRKTHVSWLRCCLPKLIWITSESMCLARTWIRKTITTWVTFLYHNESYCFICNVLLVISLYSVLIVVMKYNGGKCMHNILEANYNSNSSVTCYTEERPIFLYL